MNAPISTDSPSPCAARMNPKHHVRLQTNRASRDPASQRKRPGRMKRVAANAAARSAAMARPASARPRPTLPRPMAAGSSSPASRVSAMTTATSWTSRIPTAIRP